MTSQEQFDNLHNAVVNLFWEIAKVLKLEIMCERLTRWLTWATVEQACELEPLTRSQKFWRILL